MSIYECSITNPKKQLEFYKLLSEQLQTENQQLKEKINQYENPDDLTLFYMWLDEKAKDKMKQLKSNWNELKRWLGTRINTDKDYERHSHIKDKLQVEDYVIKEVMLYMEELEKEVK